jgi:hypothetical protein
MRDEQGGDDQASRYPGGNDDVEQSEALEVARLRPGGHGLVDVVLMGCLSRDDRSVPVEEVNRVD